MDGKVLDDVAVNDVPADAGARLLWDLRRRRVALEHLASHPLDLLLGKAAKARPGEADAVKQTALLPVADGVLVHPQLGGCLAHVHEFACRHKAPSKDR